MATFKISFTFCSPQTLEEIILLSKAKMKSNVNTGKKLKFVNSIHLIMNYNMDTNKPDNFHHKVF